MKSGKSAPSGTEARAGTTLLDAEDARREAERKYRDIFENAVEGIFQTKPGGGFITANPALARMLGFESPEELIRERAQAIGGTYYVHPERRVELKRLLDQHDTVRGFEFEAYRKDGAKIWMSDNVRAVRNVSGRLLYYEGTVEDITERKRAEQGLKQSEQDFRNLFEQAHDAILVFDPENEIVLDVNERACEVYGFARSEFIGMSLEAISKDVARGKNQIGQTLERGDYLNFETVQYRKDGTEMFLEINASTILYQGQLVILSINRDVTERKQIEEELRESEERYRDLVENSREFICTHDLDGVILSANRAAVEVLGYDPRDYTGRKNFRDLLAPEVRDQFEDYLARIRRDGSASGLTVVQTISGKRRTWEYYNTLRTEGVATPIVRGMAHDITERRETEKALRVSEQKYRDIFSLAPLGICQSLPDGTMVTANNALATMLGYDSVDELLKLKLDSDVYYVAGERQELIATYEPRGHTVDLEFQLKRKDGSPFWVQVDAHAVRGPEGGTEYFESFVRDVTERKRAEESLRKQNEYLAALHETALGLINRLDLNELLEAIVTRACGLVDIPSGYVYLIEPDGNEMSVKVGVGVSREFVGARISKGQGVAGRIWQTGQPLVVDDYRNWDQRLTDAGYDVLRLVGAVPLRSGSRVIGVLGVESTEDGQGLDSEQIEILSRFAQLASIALDNAQLHSAVQQELAERKRAEEDISNLRRELEATMNSMEEGIHRVDVNGNIAFGNPAAARMLGWEVAELLGKPAHLTMHHTKPDGAPYPKEECPIYATIRDGVPRHGANEVFWRQDGTSFPVEYMTAPMRNDRDELVATVVTFRDITDRKRAEKALSASERKYRDIFTFAPVGIYQSLRDGTLVTANKALAEMLGYDSVDELLKVNLADAYFAPARRAKLINEFEDRGFAIDLEVQWKRKDGTPIWVQLSAHAIKGANGTTEYFEGFVRDVNDRKLTESALRESEERYRELFENDRDAIYVHDLAGAYTSINRAAENLSGYSREEICGKHFWDLVAPEFLQQAGENLGKKVEELGETNYEVEIINRSGARVPVEVSSRLIYENGIAVGVQGSARDITERKRAQQALLTYSRRLLEAQEAERGRIARELHDQIGQMLTALKLNLHAIQSTGDAREASHLIEDNLKMIDQALEQVRDLSVDLRPLLLDDLGLVSALRWFVDHQAQRTGVRAEFTSDSLDPDLRFSPELETACFRIAQEALTNVARHARAKTVTVRLSRTRDYLILLVEDDGVGFDMEALQGRARTNATLGLRGMEERAHAVGGRVKIDSATDNGTQVFVELPIAMPNARKPQLQNE